MGANQGAGAAAADPYILAHEACRLIGDTKSTDYRRLRRLVALGLVGTQQIPGTRRRYLKADVERLVRDSRTPARVG